MSKPLDPLPMPNASREGEADIAHNGVVVLVGANGSGKSRLGAWIENPDIATASLGTAGGAGTKRAYRIGSQRQLSLPDEVARVSSQQATDQLARGNEMTTGPSRVSGPDPAIGVLDDFRLLLNALFARRAEIDRAYAAQARANGAPVGMPEEDPLIKLERVWAMVFPERSLEMGDHQVRALTPTGSRYNASRLSDGERVGFYLIAQVLLAPANGALVIDEPELHLHESIQARLWNALEQERTDCTFVYITHDLAFAASRVGAAKVALFDYTASENPGQLGQWDWTRVPAHEGIPEDVVLRILGSRRPTLFVEGRAGSRDQKVYEILFPDYFVVPSGGADGVDKSVRGFVQQEHLHRLMPIGLIDRDDRDDAEIEALARRRIRVLPVAAVENLLAMPECLDAFQATLGLQAPDLQAKQRDSISRVLAALRRDRDAAIKKRAVYAIRRRLHQVASSGHGREQVVAAAEQAITSADPGARFDDAKRLIDDALQALEQGDLQPALKVFRNKSVLEELASAYAMTRDAFQARILELIAQNAALRSALRDRIPVPAA